MTQNPLGLLTQLRLDYLTRPVLLGREGEWLQESMICFSSAGGWGWRHVCTGCSWAAWWDLVCFLRTLTPVHL